MQDHLDRDALERLVHRRCHASRAYGWLLHLLACTQCRERVVRTCPGTGERFLREIFRTQEPLRPPDLDSQDRLDRILADLRTHGLVEYLQEGDVPPLLADLHRHPPARQRLILDNSERLWNLSTVEYFFEGCEKELHRDPRHGQHLAELALSVIDRLSPSHYHPRLLQDLRGHAWGLRGNFLRIRERLPEARQDLTRAAASLESGTGDREETIRLVRMYASIEAAHLNYEQAIDLQQKALQMVRPSGDLKSELYGIASLVQLLPEVGRGQEAIDLGEEYLEKSPIEGDGRNALLVIQHNLAIALSKVGRGLPAYRLHQEVLRNMPIDQPRMTTKAHWVRSWILEALGELRAADEVAESVMEEVAEHLVPESCGFLMTDRARLALRRGDRLVARKYGREACQIFEERGWPIFAQATRQMLAGGPLVRF